MRKRPEDWNPIEEIDKMKRKLYSADLRDIWETVNKVVDDLETYKEYLQEMLSEF